MRYLRNGGLHPRACARGHHDRRPACIHRGHDQARVPRGASFPTRWVV
jgi:hypothetical protein